MSSGSIILGRVRLRRGWKGVGAIALTLVDGATRNGHGVGAAASNLGDGAAGVTVRGGGVVGIRMVVGGASKGGGDSGTGRMEGARVDAGSLGVAIDVAKTLVVLWIACNGSSTKVERGWQ